MRIGEKHYGIRSALKVAAKLWGVKRAQRAIFGRNSFESSLGMISLTAKEAETFRLLREDAADWQSGQALQASVTGRGQPFPPDWERMVIRSTLSADPKRVDLRNRLAAVEAQLDAIAGRVNNVVFNNAKPPIALDDQELELLRRLQDGETDWEAGQGLYALLAARDVAFPIEWEQLVLVATLLAYPDRADLVERLAFVEEQIDDEKGDFRYAVEFERMRLRAQNVGLVNEDQSPVSAEARSVAFGYAVAVLASGDFGKQTTERRHQIFKSIHDTFMAMPANDLYLIAEIGLQAFEYMLRASRPTFAQAAAIHDCLHALFFSGVSDVRDLRRFDRITPIFETWLKDQVPAPARPLPPIGEKLTIVYFLHVAHFDRGNAVSPLITSLVEMHSSRSDRRVILYAVQYVSPDFTAEMMRRGVTLRTFPQDMDYARIDEIEAALRLDNVDVVITEQNRAIAAALFVRRVARCQIWLDTGFPFWGLQSLDWTLSPPLWGRTDLPPRTSGIAWRQRLDTLKHDADAGEVQRIRASFPPGAFLLGVFVRLIKLDQAYLEFLTRLIVADPRFHLVIAGPGDASLVHTFMQKSALTGRVTLLPGMVDLNIYGRVVDVMCDTFPFVGGNACREVSVHGTPIIAKLGTPWDGLLHADRNPELLASTEEAYIALVIRLAHDPEFLARQRAVALEKAEEYCYPDEMIKHVEAAIAGALALDKNM